MSDRHEETPPGSATLPSRDVEEPVTPPEHDLDPPRPASPPASPPEPAVPVPDPNVPQHVITSTRMGALWGMAVAFAVMLLLLLIFILENGQRVDVAYFGVHGHLPLGVAMLLAAVFGVLLVVIPGIGRMAQLRWTARRHRRLDAPPQPEHEVEREQVEGRRSRRP